MNNRNNIILSPDAADGTLIDPMEQLTSDVDTSYPLLPAKLYTLLIAKVEKKAAKEKLPDGSDNFQLVFSFQTMEAYNSTTGKPLPKGHTLTHYVGVTLKSETTVGDKVHRAYTVEDIKRNVASICQSAGLVTTVKSMIDNPAQIQGKFVKANVSIDEDKTKKYPPSNRIASFEKTK